jgi:hypothetical protein
MVSAKIIIIYRTRVGAGIYMITNNRVIYKKTVEEIYIRFVALGGWSDEKLQRRKDEGRQ